MLSKHSLVLITPLEGATLSLCPHYAAGKLRHRDDEPGFNPHIIVSWVIVEYFLPKLRYGLSCFCTHPKWGTGAGEKAQQLVQRTCLVSSEGPGTLIPRGPTPSSGLLRYLHTRYTDADT